MDVSERKDRRAAGYALGAVAAVTYGLNPIFAVPLYGDGMNPDSVLLLRYLVAVPIIWGMLRLRGRSVRVSGRECGMLVAMGLLLGLSSLTLFLSYNFMNAGIASTLLFVYPVMVALIMAALFRERLKAGVLVALALVLGGIALLYRNPGGGTLSLAGTLLVMASSLSYAIYIVGVNHSCLRDVATLKVTFYVLLFGLTVFGARIAAGTPLTVPAHWYNWLNILGLAVLPTAVSFLCTTQAIQYIGPTPTAILGALEPVTAVVLGVFILGQNVSLREWEGVALILAGVMLVVGSGRLTVMLTAIRRLFPSLRHRRQD